MLRSENLSKSTLSGRRSMIYAGKSCYNGMLSSVTLCIGFQDKPRAFRLHRPRDAASNAHAHWCGPICPESGSLPALSELAELASLQQGLLKEQGLPRARGLLRARCLASFQVSVKETLWPWPRGV